MSVMVEAGYEFHFTQGNSFVLTPDKIKLMMVEKGGLYWLKLRRAVGPAAATVRVQGERPSGFKVNSTGDDAFLNYVVVDDQQNAVDVPVCCAERCESCNLSRRSRAKSVPLEVMHRRLNHMDVNKILKMAKCGDLDVNIIGKSIPVCDVCEMAKAHRRSVPKVREHEAKEDKPFERCWTDLKGAVDADFFGNRYLITFTCEVTRWSWVGFM